MAHASAEQLAENTATWLTMNLPPQKDPCGKRMRSRISVLTRTVEVEHSHRNTVKNLVNRDARHTICFLLQR
jgi:hypothetical protein